MGGALAGRGADLLIIDDPVSEQDALSPTALDGIYEWYTSGPRQRLQPGGSIIIVMTRWGIKDLTARVLQKQAQGGADKWEVVEFPAIFPETETYFTRILEQRRARRRESINTRRQMERTVYAKPDCGRGSDNKKEWWNIWNPDNPPACSYIIQSYDTAFTKNERSDFSAITTWGIFTPVEGEGDAIILLDAEKGRWDFPELKQKAMELSEAYDPDMILIEQKQVVRHLHKS